jgi:hypothetical protein
MVVDHAHRLHECVADRRANKPEPPALQVAAHDSGGFRFRRQVAEGLEMVQDRNSADKTPDVGIEGAKLFLNLKNRPCVGYGGFDLEEVSDYAGVFQYLLDPPFCEPRYLRRLEVLENRR